MPELLAVILLFRFLVLPAHAEGPETVSLDDYRAAVAQSLSLAQQAAGTSDLAGRAALLQASAGRLRSITAVRLASGERVPVDSANLLAVLANAENPGRAVERLQALQAALAQSPPAVSPADLERLRRILDNSPFADNGNNWLVRLLNAVLDWLSRLLGNTARGVYDGRDWLTLAGIAGVGAILVLFLRNLRRNAAVEEASRSPEEQALSLTSGQAMRQAQALASAGDLRGAVRQLYLATLLLLDERQLLKYDRSLTNREYLLLVAGNPALRSGLTPIVQTFDRVWYGFEPIGGEDWQSFSGQVEAVRRLAVIGEPGTVQAAAVPATREDA